MGNLFDHLLLYCIGCYLLMTFGLFSLLTYGDKWVTSRKVVDLCFFFLLLARNVEDIEIVEFGLQPVLTYVDSLDREKQLNL